MPFSKIFKDKSFDERTWIVSIVNTSRSLFGHSVLVIEAVMPSSASLQVIHFDIFARPNGSPHDNFLNRKGLITEIRRSEGYRVNQDGTEYLYSERPSKSYRGEPENVLLMINSIEEDAGKCNRGEFIPFQLLGKNHPWVSLFGDPNLGHNCASWCAEKLEIAKIKTNSYLTSSKPPRRCTIL